MLPQVIISVSVYASHVTNEKDSEVLIRRVLVQLVKLPTHKPGFSSGCDFKVMSPSPELGSTLSAVSA